MNIDTIPSFVLTLRTHPERTEYIKQHMAQRGVNAKLFYGFDGRQAGVIAARQYMRDHNADPVNHNPITVSQGVTGCALSWLSVVKMGLVQGYEWMLVFEDDAELAEDFGAKFNMAMAHMPNGTDLVYLQYDARHRQRVPINAYHSRFMPPVLCTGCLLLSRWAMKVIDAHGQDASQPFDVLLHDVILPKLNWTCVYPQIVGQLSGDDYPLDGGKARLKSCM